MIAGESRWRAVFGKALPAAAVVMLAVIVLAAAFAPLLAPYAPNQMDLAHLLAPPSALHWAGTDELGRDILSRLLFGARPSLLSGLLIVAISASGGLLVGSFAGLKGGAIDTALMRLVDLMLALPGMVVALALTAALGPSLFHAVLALGILSIPGSARVVRGQALTIRNADYVQSSRLIGMSDRMILVRHIVPNVMPPLVVYMSFQLGGAVLATAALSFIGLGQQPPDPEWGAMIGAGREFFLQAWWYVTLPGLAVILTAVSANLVGDGLRDVLDPRDA